MQHNNHPLYGKLASLYYDTKEQYATRAEVDFYASFMSPGHRVLEAMSGSGRLQIPLLQAGYHVDGVDNSPNMLARCRQRCAHLKFTPHLYEQSLEDLKLVDRYNLCIIAMGSFQLIADTTRALQALQKLRAHMHDQAILLLDIFVPSNTTDTTRETDVAFIDAHHAVTCSTRYFFHKNKKRVDALCSYELIVDGRVQEQEDELMEFVWYDDHELKQLLNQAGFDMTRIHEQSFRSAGISRIVQATARPK